MRNAWESERRLLARNRLWLVGVHLNRSSILTIQLYGILSMVIEAASRKKTRLWDEAIVVLLQTQISNPLRLIMYYNNNLIVMTQHQMRRGDITGALIGDLKNSLMLTSSKNSQAFTDRWRKSQDKTCTKGSRKETMMLPLKHWIGRLFDHLVPLNATVFSNHEGNSTISSSQYKT